MRRTEQLQGLRMLKLRDVLSRWEAAELSQAEAGELLGMSERTLRRWARRFEEDGADGLVACDGAKVVTCVSGGVKYGLACRRRKRLFNLAAGADAGAGFGHLLECQ